MWGGGEERWRGGKERGGGKVVNLYGYIRAKGRREGERDTRRDR